MQRGLLRSGGPGGERACVQQIVTERKKNSLTRFVVDARATPSVHSENKPAGCDFDFVWQFYGRRLCRMCFL